MPAPPAAASRLIRSLLLLKQARRELTRIVHPRAVVPVTLGGAVVPNQVLMSVLAFMLFYGAVDGDREHAADVLRAWTWSAPPPPPSPASTTPARGWGRSGPSGNYQGLNDFQTWVCTFAMLLGRLELLSVLVLFTPAFWRR